MNLEMAVLTAVALPLIAVLAIYLTRRHAAIMELVPSVAAAATALVTLYIALGGIAGSAPSWTIVELLPGAGIVFSVTPLGAVFAVTASILWLVTTVYSRGYLTHAKEGGRARFHAYFTLAMSAAMGVAYSGSLLTLFLFYEILTLSTYPLVVHHGGDKDKAAGRLYLGILASTALVLLVPGIFWTLSLAGTLDFQPGGVLPASVPGATVIILAVLFVFGFSKAALFPFHAWLPAAMVAPTPVSALLHAVAVVKSGVFAILQVLSLVIGLDQLSAAFDLNWFLYIPAVTVIFASVAAMRQPTLKGLLAYSTVSQLAYIVLVAALLTPLSQMAAGFHIVAHATAKIALFFAVGVIYVATKKTLVSEVDGLAARMPWTMGTVGVAVASMIGLPFTGGFISKWYMFKAALSLGDMVFIAVFSAATLFNVLYFGPLIYRAYCRPAIAGDPAKAPATTLEAPISMLAPLVLVGAFTVALFFVHQPVLDFLSP